MFDTVHEEMQSPLGSNFTDHAKTISFTTSPLLVINTPVQYHGTRTSDEESFLVGQGTGTRCLAFKLVLFHHRLVYSIIVLLEYLQPPLQLQTWSR